MVEVRKSLNNEENMCIKNTESAFVFSLSVLILIIAHLFALIASLNFYRKLKVIIVHIVSFYSLQSVPVPSVCPHPSSQSLGVSAVQRRVCFT